MTIERTVGTGVGADYENWWNVQEWIETAGALTDNYDFIQVADVVMLNAQVWSGDIYPAGYTIRFICPWADSHQGDPTKGFLTTFNAGAEPIRPDFRTIGGANTAGTVEIDGLYLICA